MKSYSVVSGRFCISHSSLHAVSVSLSLASQIKKILPTSVHIRILQQTKRVGRKQAKKEMHVNRDTEPIVRARQCGHISTPL